MLRVPIYNVKRVTALPGRIFVDNRAMMLRTLIALSGALAAFAAAPASAATVPLAAHETFGGTVNGVRPGATIRMACFGPDRPGRTGHPMAGQTVGLFVPEAMTGPFLGRTGNPARAIVVSIVTGPGTGVRIARIRRLDQTRPVLSATRRLPTWPMLPCSGRARVVFTPVPMTAGARAATVDVTLAAQLVEAATSQRSYQPEVLLAAQP